MISAREAPGSESSAAPMLSVSVVTPVFGDGHALQELTARLANVLEPRCGANWELIAVNDGSPDATWRAIVNLSRSRRNVVGISLLRNFGQHNALLAGIRHTRGAIVVTIDDDLQQPPEALPELLARLDHADVVYGVPSTRSSSLSRRLAGTLLRLALATVLGVQHARQIAPFRAFRASLKPAFLDYRSPYVSIDVLLTWATTRMVSVAVPYEHRRQGKSGYTLRRLLSLAVTMIVGFSVWPLRLVSAVGLACALFGVAVLLWVLLRYMVAGATVPGFAFLACIIAIFSGAQLLALGIIGEYLSRMYFRMMNRPAYVIHAATGPAGRVDH